MRLIDADDLIKAFEALDLMSGQYAESFTNMAGNRSMEIECAKNYIDNAKTIDSMPVVHAHWFTLDPTPRTGRAYKFVCSNCGRVVFTRWQESIDELGYAFCPHCGSKMDDEVQ